MEVMQQTRLRRIEIEVTRKYMALKPVQNEVDECRKKTDREFA
jgi:hypothetical protein